MKAFKFRLKPNQEQETKLRQIGGGCRWLWNQMLANNHTIYNQSKAALNLKSWAISEINRTGTVRIYAQGDTAGGAANMEAASHVSLNCEKFGASLGAEARVPLGRG